MPLFHIWYLLEKFSCPHKYTKQSYFVAFKTGVHIYQPEDMQKTHKKNAK